MQLLMVFATIGLFVGAYLAVGYVVTTVTITLHKSKKYPFLDGWYRGADYSGEIVFWPITIIAIIVERVCKLGAASRRLIERTTARVAPTGLSPEVLATRIVNRNQMTILQSGEESQDG